MGVSWESQMESIIPNNQKDREGILSLLYPLLYYSCGMAGYANSANPSSA